MGRRKLRVEREEKHQSAKKYIDSIFRFVRSEGWLRKLQVVSMRPGVKCQKPLLKDFEGLPFGVGVHKEHLVVYYSLEFAIDIGITRLLKVFSA